MSEHISHSELPKSAFTELDTRSREIFRAIVDSYFNTGEPLGSRNLSKQLEVSVSPATVRNVMSDLEALGLIYAPHTSAGRLPTDIGLRFFVDSFIEFGDLNTVERREIEDKVEVASEGQTMDNILTEASNMLSGLSRSAGIVVTTKSDLKLKHIEFIRLEPKRALVVIVGENGSVENRIISLPPGTTASSLVEASNYINAKIAGLTISEAQLELEKIKNQARGELDILAQKLVDQGIAVWTGGTAADGGQLIISGHSNLLNNLEAMDDIEHVRKLFSELESKDNFLKLLELTEEGEGVRIFIGSENKLFSMSGTSVIVAPYRNNEQRVVGAIGIVGPTRLNYARIVPMVDYTANIISKFIR